MVGCHNHYSNKPDNGTEEYSMEERNFFDLNKEHIATDEEMLSVKNGMTFTEVVNIIGKPHGYGTMGAMTLKWFTKEGTIYNIKFIFNDDFVQDAKWSLNDYYKYAIVLSSPMIDRVTE